MCRSSCTACRHLVTPGMAPTPQARLRLRLLMRLLLPTLGYPTTPTVMEVLAPPQRP